ncbi:hypothetical protein BXU11_03660 [Flavobacterium sp. LM5]|jgi:hypothetical protein|uniref:type IX secretion system protein PorG n=1 Tax=Flavobacterium sp. LM5 TaxID=1938610 RepID=UPI0009921CCB|nr:DUF6089 family protein [Flavobacterium sp. LM5]OOV29037.1 hypothetical protein BXU11_03660 [Flavobacterium sp. LM5]
MNKFVYLLLILFSGSISYSQIHEIGIFAGGSNYVGDIGPTTYIAPNKMAYGILYKWNKSPRHAYRFSYTQSQLYSNDADSKENSRLQRGYSFKNNIKELSGGLEFNFFDFNLHESKVKVTPYVFSGLNFFFHDELYIDSIGDTYKDKTSNSIAIPMAIGIKSNFSRRFVIGLEVGARYTFTDNIDGNNPSAENLQNLRFGNINNTDWYVFSGITLTYTFGEKPCYCAY